MQHVERARDRIAHPVGFLAESVDDVRLAQLLLAFRPRLLRGFAGSGLFFFPFPVLGRMELVSPELVRGKRGGLSRTRRGQGQADRFGEGGRAEEALRHHKRAAR